MSIERFYTDIFTINSVSSTKSASGVVKETYTNSLPQKGKIDPISVEVNYLVAGAQVRATHKLFCSASVAIKEKDLVIYDVKKFDVLEVKDIFNKGHHLEIILRSR